MRQKNNKLAVFCNIALCVALSITDAKALETDSEQPITIDSNTATYDDKTATSIYTGNVVSIQGSIHVTSDQLVVYFKDGDAEKLVFTGKKAKFSQTPSVGAKDITGEALTGEYYPKKNLLVLIDEATVWQGAGSYASQIIKYDSKNSVVKAGEKTSDSKVHVVLQPKNKAPAKPTP
ncbi:lipopolysaccharide transport periplasmic protein LptA [Crenothrix polyspora]|jgi:lipopolysaccharide export system protein LptA|uniref:Lipopolysaccharide export system protein LptA n=1 Tax=Crenothrix polyspora TaxID=360316 RepID=A0A1R4GYW1_9GAMM|nr:lipopolysaccharide transport periplasmic protein LptA [Crenothrix polyspora]SJM89177.1 Lipopolysaccharide transport periplasmic protein LptA [Crenothrix polyspora]